ncbi:DUF2653 family protein [Neobacillus fumarioli]|uniref:DUF2653 family protein n=1 Tax=Neobacillus fumarioli TaxID=105229 RepID=UPI0008375C5E|nr:DUF2653 family protein [Neobacillus fumarioli]
MEILFNEQDLIDSVCVYVAAKEYTNPESVEADLMFNPSFGFSAEANIRGRIRNLTEQDLIDAVAVYLRDYHHFNPDHLLVDLRFAEREGITASIQVR